MKICFVLSAIATEKSGSSIRLITQAHDRKHEVYVCGVGGFTFNSSGPIEIEAVKIPTSSKKRTPDETLEYLQGKKTDIISSTDLDVLFLRNNPTEESGERQWAEFSGIGFGQMIQDSGVLVLNDAHTLANAFIDKLYFESLPEYIKPKSIITRDHDRLMKFYEEMGNKMVLKPLEGSGGQNVYMIDKHEKNTTQIIETIARDGYVIAQEFLPEVKNGDVRVLLVNGRIVEEDGNKGIIRRVASEGEFRSNFSLGATADSSELTPAMQEIVDIVAPKLIKDGLFFVGLDIVDDKLIEINLLSPGGLERFKDIDLPDFSKSIIQAIERKIHYRDKYKGALSNKILATMD
ncbi:ATP-grasp domain-containing protein [Nonlabens marinus]|uniref:Similar to Glutathione synthetase n=1 Tax=Nonlabens marinus S1-08 TaxID=1454201 RepID=W8VZN7_9FLAO|nr:glutathione synthetase [Nonlabens marinus]BAO54896.1 similar to Glutathione synthetase [Nonlabens marinus S1-08]